MLAAPLKGMDAEALAGDAELREAMPDDVSTPPMGTDAGEDSNKDEQTGSTGGSDSDSPMASTALPSIGSALHASGKCSRCCFYLKNRCRNGINCQFCHLPHERRSRGRGCRGHGTSKLTEAQDVKDTILPGLMRPPPGLDLVPPVPHGLPHAPPGLDSPKGFGHMTLAAYSQPPTPQGGPLAPARMAMSLPSTPSGAIPGRCLTRTAPPAPPLLPPSGPPRGLPQDDDKAPPPPENSPGGLCQAPTLTPTALAAPGTLLTAAAQAAEAAGVINKFASTPSLNRGPLLSTQPPSQPPTPQAEKRPSAETMPGPPGTFFSKSETCRSSPSSPNAPLLGTVPCNGSLPRLLGSRGPPGLPHPAKVADGLSILQTEPTA